MKKYRFISAVVLFALVILSPEALFAQTCTNDTSDPGNCDTLWIEQENGRIQPNTTVIRHIWAYHDEPIVGMSIPIIYKNPQTDVFLDSAKLPAFYYGFCYDTVINRNAGTIIFFTLCDPGGILPPGTDTFAILYFRTGPSWDPSVHNPLDTFRIGGPTGQGLSFVDTTTPNPHDIQPVYNPPGDLDVGDDPKAQLAKPKSFILSQNYPNPFNAETVISFSLPRSSNAKIEIFNILGQKVRDLVDENVSAGYKQVVWDGKDDGGKNVSSGIYLYRIRAEDFVETRKMTLLK